MARTYYPKAHHPLILAALQDVVSIPEALQRLRDIGTPYHRRTVTQWCDFGYIAATKNHLGHWRLSWTSLHIFLQQSARIDHPPAA